MHAVLLVGGEGTRLRPLTDNQPKPMLSLVDRPFINHQLDHLKRHGVTDVILSCGYLPDVVERFFRDGRAFGMRITYVVDPFPLGTAGAVKNAEAHLGREPFFVFNGDILTDLDLTALRDAHVASGAHGTIALTPVEDPSAFGLVRLNPDRSVEAFLEKPSRDMLRPGEPFNINAGTYLLGPEVLAAIPSGEKCSIERDTFPIVAARGALYGYPSDAYWRDIGTHRSYLEAHHDLLAGIVTTESPTGDRYLGPATTIAAGATVGGHSSIGPGCAIANGARVVGSVLGRGVRVGRGANVTGAIVGDGARLDEGCVVEAGAVIGGGARVAAGGRVLSGAIVATGDQVSPGREVTAAAGPA